jgi:hypothetical protein
MFRFHKREKNRKASLTGRAHAPPYILLCANTRRIGALEIGCSVRLLAWKKCTSPMVFKAYFAARRKQIAGDRFGLIIT